MFSLLIGKKIKKTSRNSTHITFILPIRMSGYRAVGPIQSCRISYRIPNVLGTVRGYNRERFNDINESL